MRWLFGLGLILCAGCGKEPPAAAGPEPAKAAAEEKKRPGEVVLDAAMVKSGGIEAVEVSERSVPVVLRVNGRLTANEERTWHVGAMTEGRVMKLLANVGDRVAERQVLAGMHAHELHEARSEYQRARTDLAKLVSQQAYAERQRDRMKRLFALKAASLEQVEHAESQVRDAVAAVANAKTEVERTRVHLVEFLDVPADDHPAHTAGDFEHDEDLIPLRAPNAGVVLSRATTAGSVVKPGDDVYVISDLSTVWMMAALPEDQVPNVRVGMGVEVTVQAYPDRRFAGRIARIGDEMDPQTRTLPVRVLVPNAGQLLRPEMYATAEVAAGGSERRLFVPQAALQDVNGQAVVFVAAEGGRFVVRPVRTGRVEGAWIEAVEGLRAGERVVAKGAFVLKSQLFKSSLVEE